MMPGTLNRQPQLAAGNFAVKHRSAAGAAVRKDPNQPQPANPAH